MVRRQLPIVDTPFLSGQYDLMRLKFGKASFQQEGKTVELTVPPDGFTIGASVDLEPDSLTPLFITWDVERAVEREVFLAAAFTVEGKEVDSGTTKLGVIIGDHSKAGINSSLSPGVKIGPFSIVGAGVNLQEDLEPGRMLFLEKQSGVVKENTVDASKEKHVPVIEKTKTGVRVKIGSIPHPMEEKHYIEWIELLTDDKVYRKTLKPGEKPQAEFCVSTQTISARIHCNMHGLWRSK
jgi:superoxide reductase